MNQYKVEYDWVEEFLRRELPKYEMRRDPTMSQADCLEYLISKDHGSIGFYWGAGLVLAVWIIVEICEGMIA